MAGQFYILGGLLFAFWAACLYSAVALGADVFRMPGDGPRWTVLVAVGQQLPGLVPALLCVGIGRVVQLLERLVDRSVGRGEVVVGGRPQQTTTELLEEIRDRLGPPNS